MRVSLKHYFPQQKETPVYEQYDPLLHGDSRARNDHILSVQFMRKYIHIAKYMKPKLSENACEIIANEYSRLRSQELVELDVARTQPVTPRTLETLIRLSTAHAKARMSNTVTVADANAAIELIQYAYFKKVLEKEKKKRRRSAGDSDDDDNDEDDDSEVSANRRQTEQSTTGTPPTRPSKRTRAATAAEIDSDTETFETPVDLGDLTRRTTLSAPSSSSAQMDTSASDSTAQQQVAAAVEISSERLKTFRQLVYHAFRESRDQTVPVTRLTEFVNRDSAVGSEPFSSDEIASALARMTDDNQVMVADGIVFLI